MGNPRSYTTKYVANRDALEAFTKAKAGRSMAKRQAAIKRAADGRPSDLAKQARVELSLRRIAGASALSRKARGQG